MKQFLLITIFLFIFSLNGKSAVQEVSQLDKMSYRIEKIYPNPAKNRLVVDFFSEEYLLVQFELIDILGNKVKQWKKVEVAPGLQKLSFNLEEFSAGIYLLKAQAGREVVVERIRKL